MSLTVPMQVAVEFRTCGNQGRVEGLRQNLKIRGQLCLLGSKLSSVSLKQYSRSTNVPNRFLKRPYYLTSPCSRNIGLSSDTSFAKNGTLNLACCNYITLTSISRFSIWGLGRVLHPCRSICQNKSDGGLKKGGTYYVTTSYIIPLFLWAGVMFNFRPNDPIIPPTEAGQILKQLVNFVGSVSAALTFNYLVSCIELLAKKVKDPNDVIRSTNPVILFMGRVVYYVLRIVATLSFIEVSGYSIMKWNIGNVFVLVFSMLVWREILKRMRADKSTLTLKGGATDIRNPSTAAEDASLNSLDGISMQVESTI